MGLWEALMGSNIECYRHLPGGSDLHLSHRKVLTVAALDAATSRPRASWTAGLGGRLAEGVSLVRCMRSIRLPQARGDSAQHATAGARKGPFPALSIRRHTSSRSRRAPDSSTVMQKPRECGSNTARRRPPTRNETDTSSDRGRLWAQRHAHLGHLRTSYT